MTRLHLVVRGRVQGVGFRWHAKGSAESLGLAGFARNLKDGTVEIEAEGDAAALEEFIELLKTGNPHARVDDVTRRTVEPKGDRGFRTA